MTKKPACVECGHELTPCDICMASPNPNPCPEMWTCDNCGLDT